jgi:hypothetical protein
MRYRLESKQVSARSNLPRGKLRARPGRDGWERPNHGPRRRDLSRGEALGDQNLDLRFPPVRGRRDQLHHVLGGQMRGEEADRGQVEPAVRQNGRSTP